MSPMPEVVHLHVRSDYSLGDSVVRVRELARAAADMNVSRSH